MVQLIRIYDSRQDKTVFSMLRIFHQTSLAQTKTILLNGVILRGCKVSV